MRGNPVTWIQNIVDGLRARPELVGNLVAPALIFVIDLILRMGLCLDLIDAGADLSLLALSCMLFPLTAATGTSTSAGQHIQKRPDVVDVVLLLFFLFLWLVALSCISDTAMLLSALSKSLRTVMSIGIGAGALVLASVLLPILVDRTPSR